MRTEKPTVKKAAPSRGGAKKKSRALSPVPEKIPGWIAINLLRQDAEAWSAASKVANMLLKDYAIDILRRTAELPRKDQPSIRPMPQSPGNEWPGNRWVLKCDEPLGRAIANIARVLGVSISDWVYSAIIVESSRLLKSTAVKSDSRKQITARLPFNMPIGIEEAKPFSLPGVSVRLRIPEAVLEDLSDVKVEGLLRQWGLRDRSGARQAWDGIVEKAPWTRYRKRIRGATSINYSFSMRDWEKICQLAEFLEITTEILIAGALFHAAAVGKEGKV